jgi:hypothetical protein
VTDLVDVCVPDCVLETLRVAETVAVKLRVLLAVAELDFVFEGVTLALFDDVTVREGVTLADFVAVYVRVSLRVPVFDAVLDAVGVRLAVLVRVSLAVLEFVRVGVAPFPATHERVAFMAVKLGGHELMHCRRFVCTSVCENDPIGQIRTQLRVLESAKYPIEQLCMHAPVAGSANQSVGHSSTHVLLTWSL